MKIDFEKEIIELLENNQYVVLPNFGGFVLKSIPSSINQHVIYPPSKEIAFNKSLIHDDELLTGAIMKSYQLDYQSAKNSVFDYTTNLSISLRKNKNLSLNKIGAFSVGENGQLVFKPFLDTIQDKESFGLGKIHSKILTKEIIAVNNKATEQKLAEKQEEIAVAKTERQIETRKKSKLPLVGFISSFLLIAGIVGLMASDGHFANPNFQKASFIDVFFPSDSQLMTIESARKEFNGYAQIMSQKENMETGRIFNVYQKDLAAGYYIVLGSYSSKENAERLENLLFADGKDSYILPSDSGFYRVCMYADADFIKAKAIFEEKLTANKDVWMLKNTKN